MRSVADKTVKAVAISNCALTRKQIDKLLTDCEVQAGAKGYWFKVDEKGDLAGGIAKFVDKEAASRSSCRSSLTRSCSSRAASWPPSSSA